MKPPAWWPLTTLEIIHLILGVSLIIALNVQWLDYYQNEGYPMESNVPPASWVVVLYIALVMIALLLSCSFSKEILDEVRWFTCIPVFVAGVCNILWLITMFTSWFGSMSYPNIWGVGSWSCWMVGGGYWLGVFLAVPIAYLYGLKIRKSENAAFQLAAGVFLMVSGLWYWDSWII